MQYTFVLVISAICAQKPTASKDLTLEASLKLRQLRVTEKGLMTWTFFNSAWGRLDVKPGTTTERETT